MEMRNTPDIWGNTLLRTMTCLTAEGMQNMIPGRQMQGFMSSMQLMWIWQKPRRKKNIFANCFPEVTVTPSVSTCQGTAVEMRRRLAKYGDKQLEVFFGILVASAPKKYMISKLEWRKIKWKQNYIEVVINEKERGILYLDNYTMDKLTELRKERKDKHIKKKWIFITRHKGNWKDIGDSTITYWLNKIAKIAEVDRLTISNMKATMLHYLKNGRRFSDEKVNKILNMSCFDNEFRSIYLQDLEEIIKME